jgi:antitoxin StbD
MEYSMVDPILAEKAVSISVLKKSPSAVLELADGAPVAVLNHNRPAAYLVPADTWAALMERLEDIELVALVRLRAEEIPVRVSLDEL